MREQRQVLHRGEAIPPAPGRDPFVIPAPGLYSFAVREFGHWLRLRAGLSGSGSSVKLLTGRKGNPFAFSAHLSCGVSGRPVSPGGMMELLVIGIGDIARRRQTRRM